MRNGLNETDLTLTLNGARASAIFQIWRGSISETARSALARRAGLCLSGRFSSSWYSKYEGMSKTKISRASERPIAKTVLASSFR
jgi:hypothetical protein